MVVGSSVAEVVVVGGSTVEVAARVVVVVDCGAVPAVVATCS